jgi:hypothetical protein
MPLPYLIGQTFILLPGTRSFVCPSIVWSRQFALPRRLSFTGLLPGQNNVTYLVPPELDLLLRPESSHASCTFLEALQWGRIIIFISDFK